MKFLVLDVETSGLPRYDRQADHPSQPHVASVSMIFTDEELAVEKEYYALIKPTDWEMEPGAMAVNGLTMEKLHAEGVPIADALGIYTAAILDGRAVGAHNAQFDVKMMRAELRRAGMDDLFEKTPNVCTMRATAEVMRIAPTNKMMAAGYKKFKPPKLLEAYRFLFNRDFPGAHTATGDAMACLEILRELKRNGALPAPEIHYAKEGTKAGEALKARAEAKEVLQELDRKEIGEAETQ